MILRYGADSVTVRGLLGENTLLWDDVCDITVHKAGFYNLKVLFSSGSLRNLVIHSRRNRFGGAETLHMPVDLVGLDHDALAALLSRLLQLQAGAPLAAATARQAVPQPTVATAPEPFDPDAIMARYLADREALIASQPGRTIARATFGRKRA